MNSTANSYGPWRLLRQVGAGGMGVVYEAIGDNGQRAAVKVVSSAFAADPAFRARFRREIEIGRKVAGRRTGAVLDADPNGDPPWLASEFIDGPTLAEAVDRNGPLTAEPLLAFAVAVAEALAEVHAAGVIHRDLKPTNVILTADTPKVIDFGIAAAAEATSLTATGTSLGSAGWMSPEQVRGEPITSASDVFAWGATVTFAATGRPPFGTGRPEALAYRVVHGAPDLGGVPKPLRAVVEAALSPAPHERPSVASLISQLAGSNDLGTVAEGWAAVPATAITPPARSESTAAFAALEVGAGPNVGSERTGFFRRWSWALAVSAVVLIAIAAISFVGRSPGEDTAAAVSSERSATTGSPTSTSTSTSPTTEATTTTTTTTTTPTPTAPPEPEMLDADLISDGQDLNPNNWRLATEEPPLELQERVLDEWASVYDFPYTMNGCGTRQLRVRWRSLGVNVQPGIFFGDPYPGQIIPDLVHDFGPSGTMIMNGCEQPVFRAEQTSPDGGTTLADVAVYVEVFYPSAG